MSEQVASEDKDFIGLEFSDPFRSEIGTGDIVIGSHRGFYKDNHFWEFFTAGIITIFVPL